MVRRLGRRPTPPKSQDPEPERMPTFVFVVTYGRSGSTLVQGLLNALPATLVRGENGLYAVDLFQAHRRATTFAEAHAHHRPRKVESAFFGAHLVTDERLAGLERSLMLGLLLGDGGRKRPLRMGFKEVLWHRIPAEDTEAFFDWFEQVFPDARYVLNTRKMEDASASGFWRSYERDDALGAMGRVVDIQEYLRSTRPERVLDTRYEIITGDDKDAADQALAALSTFVTGKVNDKILERMRQVLAVGHGPHPFRASRSRSEAENTDHG